MTSLIRDVAMIITRQLKMTTRPSLMVIFLIVTGVVVLLELQISSLGARSSQLEKHMTAKSFDDSDTRFRTSNSHHAPKLPVVLYNRVPKTGSTTFTNLVYTLTKPNEMYVLHINTSGNNIKMAVSDQIHLAWNISHWEERKPAFYHGHFCFYSFSQFGFDNPLYINIIREPLDRLVSHYYFLRYGDDYRKGLKRMRQGDTTTFDECIEDDGHDCQPRQLWLQIPMLCGQSAECWKVGSSWALAQAKQNLVMRYTLVGITERMDEFLAVLEAMVPRLFKGITAKFREGSKSHVRNTLHKDPLSEKTLNFMRSTKTYRMEREFYDFASKHFDFLKRQITDESGQIMPSQIRYRYEKVYGPYGLLTP